MKTSRRFAVVTTVVIIGYFAVRWCAAQPERQSSRSGFDKYGFGALNQLTSFVSCLQETKQTNVLQRFNDYANASLASRNYADLGVTLHILQDLRGGRTNEAYELLEGRMETDIIGFAASYRELPGSVRQQASLRVLKDARDYRAKFPFKDRYANFDQRLAEAFKILDEPTK